MGSPDEVVPVSSRERRLAEAVLGLLDQQAMPDSSFDAVVAEARAVLASPEADPKAWVEVRRVLSGWDAVLMRADNCGVVLSDPFEKSDAVKEAQEWAAALDLPVREPKP